MANHRKIFSWYDIASYVGVLVIIMFFMWVQHSDYQNALNILTDEIKVLRSENSKKLDEFRVSFEGMTFEEEVTNPSRNNNPGNLRYDKRFQWKGQIGKDSRNFIIFEHYSYGLRAIAITLNTYQEKRGLRTLRTMMKKYSETDHVSYAKFIGKKLGLGIDEEFNVMGHMPGMLKAIVRYETGEQPYPDHVFALAGIYATNE